MKTFIKLLLFIGLLFTTSFAQVLKVDDYGAVGDGVTDDRAAIQHAFDALKEGGGELQFTSGKTYIIAKGLELNFFSASHQYLITTTDTEKATIKIKDAAPISYGYWGIFIAESQNITIKNLRIDGNRDTRNPTGEVADVYLVEIRNKCDGLRFYDLELINSVMDNIYVSVSGDETDTTRWTSDFEMYNCVLRNGYRNNMSVIRGRNYKIIGCEFDNANGHDPETGIDFEPNRGDGTDIGYENMLIEGCVFKNNARYGIMLTHKTTNSGRCIVKNCTFDNNGLQLASQSNIVNNNIFINVDHSMDYGGPIDGIINFIDGDAENNEIYNNYFYNNPMPDYSHLIYFSGGALGGNIVRDNYAHNNNVLDFTANSSSFSQIINDNIFLNRGETGYWNMDADSISGTNLYDLSDFRQTGVLYGDPAIVEGKINDALDFSPDDKYVDIPLKENIDIEMNLTLSAWIKWNGTNSESGQVIIGRGDDWYFGINNSGRLEFYASSSKENSYNGGLLETDAAVPMNEWNYVVLTYNGRYSKIYINGIEAASLNAYGKLDTTSASVYIASLKDGQKSFNGIIDEVKIYNYALSGGEIYKTFEEINKGSAVRPIGSGTEADPYQIASLSNLLWLAQTDSIWDDGAYFEQMADINAAATDTMTIGGWNPGWSAIGNVTTPFSGVYNGGGYVIDSLFVHGSNANSGLFGAVRGLTVKDLGLTNVEMEVGSSSGALVGFADTSLTVTNCYATGNIVAVGAYDGGLIGFIGNAKFDILDSHTDVNIINTGTGDGVYAGGFIGYMELTGDNEYGGTIADCYATGDVALTDQVGGHGYAGGFIARAHGTADHTKWSEIKRCYSTGDVTGAIGLHAYGPAGGFIGNLDWRYKVSECYSTGDVINMAKDTGGFAGYVKYETMIENSYSLGNVIRVEGSDQVNYGGFVGCQNAWSGDGVDYFNTIKNCYSVGSVSGMEENGYGFSGCKHAWCIDTLNYWDKEVSGQDSTVGNATGLTTAEMKDQASYAGWDFDNVWEVNNNYPNLINNSNDELEEIGDGAVKPEGSGTEEDPYKISSLSDLSWLAQNDTAWTSYFIQTADIDASQTATWDDSDDNNDGDKYNDANDLTDDGTNDGWLPLGNISSFFSGYYDGNGYTINHLTVKRAALSYVGFFGNIQKDFGSPATVKNLELKNIDFTGDSFLGGFTGQNISGTISGCSTSGVINSNSSGGYVGGFVGYNHEKDAKIIRCISDVTVNAAGNGEHIGGFVGRNRSNTSEALIIECCSLGSVTSDGGRTGGFAGQNAYSRISNCYSLSEVIFNGTSDQAGGFIGRNYTATIEYCYFAGSYNADSTKGFLGSEGGEAGTYTSNFLDTLASGCNQSFLPAAAIEKSTIEMKTASTYKDVGWDFNNTWEIVGDNYPTFKDIAVSVENKNPAKIPAEYVLQQNYPNPFNPVTTIIFSLEKDGNTVLEVYNVLGQKVAELVNRELSAGSYKYNFNGINLPSGLYFYKLQSGRFTQIRKMILIK